MNDLERTIVERLEATNGNVRVVAEELNISPSYVNRVKKAHSITFVEPSEVGSTALIVSPSPITAADVTPKSEIGKASELLAPNIAAVGEVRDRTLAEIVSRLENGELTAKDLINVLKTILVYETRLKAVSQPSVTLVDQRTQNVTLYQLVDRLAQNVSEDTLRQLTGIKPPQNYIEGEVVIG